MLRDKPDSATLQLTLADLYEQTDRRPQAEALYRAVLERDPNNLPAANNLAWTAVTNPEKIPFALKLIESTIERHGPLDDLLDTRGRLLVSAGRFEEGLRDLRESADAAPSAARFVQLAVVYQSAGRPRDAQAALEQARRFGLRPGDIPGHDAPVVRELAKF
jgi:tetratricopeptide (TPR) repeat protein